MVTGRSFSLVQGGESGDGVWPPAGNMTKVWSEREMIEQLLGELSKSTFVEEYYFKLPFSLPGCARQFTYLGSWEMVETILAQPDTDVLVVRQGELWKDKTRPSYSEGRTLHAAGYTLVIRNSEKHHPRLAELAAGFREDFQGAVDIQIYCTPANQRGFGWHYDAEDVFILQTQGGKEYSLRKNTVNPWPLVETLPPDMAYEREIMPLIKCMLWAGDWLYIPAGYWHTAKADEESISLAVGVRSTTAMDVYNFLRQRLLHSLMWRQRLPPPGRVSALSMEELVDRYRSLFAELGDDLAKMMRESDLVRAFLATKGRPPED
jgi:50S ribosomal protein L16 3-hydroxylase